ncbi:hypothetical protein ACFQYP_41550 [Nonomuraea antimicrobica]
MALAARLFQADRGLGFGAGADLLGAFLVTSGLMLLVYTINQAEVHGWGSAHTLGFGAVSIVLLAGFVLRQAKAADPLLPLRLFRSRPLWGPTSSRSCSWPPCSASSSCWPCTCSRSTGTPPSRPAWRTCPVPS